MDHLEPTLKRLLYMNLLLY